LTAINNARAGQPAMMRLTVPDPAVATLAARLPAVPIASAVQGSKPERCPARRSASRASEATISMPSTVIFSFQDRQVVGLGGHVEDGVVDVTAMAA